MGEHDPALHLEANAGQYIGGAVDTPRQFTVRVAGGVVDEGGLAGAAGSEVALDQVVCRCIVADADDWG
jgi:hypothetical protein